MAYPIVAIIFGVSGGLIGASIYEGSRFDTHRMWDGRYVQVINTKGDLVDEYR